MLLLALVLISNPPPIETLAPNASGLALVEVVEVKEYDRRPADGNKGVSFTFKRVRGSGEFREEVRAVTDFNDMRPANTKPQVSAPLKPDSLKKGERYWIAFASRHDYKTHDQGVVGFWPEKSKMAEVLEAAVNNDFYRWWPQYVPELKLSYGHIIEEKQWRLRGERDGKVLWEKTLLGKPVNSYMFGMVRSAGGTLEIEMPKGGQMLFTESDASLEKDNEFGLPEGPYKVNNGLNPETGKRHGTWIRQSKGPHLEVLNRAYDLDTGKPILDQCFDALQTGGKAVGGVKDVWWRKIEKTYDASGKVSKEEVFRYDESAGRGKEWVKVK